MVETMLLKKEFPLDSILIKDILYQLIGYQEEDVLFKRLSPYEDNLLYSVDAETMRSMRRCSIILGDKTYPFFISGRC